ncbi:hypothetical protein ABK040_001696 [Willaertia magna]
MGQVAATSSSSNCTDDTKYCLDGLGEDDYYFAGDNNKNNKKPNNKSVNIAQQQGRGRGLSGFGGNSPAGGTIMGYSPSNSSDNNNDLNKFKEMDDKLPIDKDSMPDWMLDENWRKELYSLAYPLPLNPIHPAHQKDKKATTDNKTDGNNKEVVNDPITTESTSNFALTSTTLSVKASPSLRIKNIEGLLSIDNYMSILGHICSFLDIRSIIYCRLTNKKIYEELVNYITHFIYVPILDEETKSSSGTPFFPPQQTHSSFWEPIIKQYPNLENFNEKHFERNIIKNYFPNYTKMVLKCNEENLFNNFEELSQYRHVNSLEISCLKNCNNDDLNLLFENLPLLRRVCFYYCQFKNHNRQVQIPVEEKEITTVQQQLTNNNKKVAIVQEKPVDYIIDPTCVIDFTKLNLSLLEEISIFCIQSTYNVRAILNASLRGECKNLNKFQFSSKNNVIGGAEKLLEFCKEQKNNNAKL